MNNFTYFYDKLLNLYNVTSLKDLSEATNIPISTISSIKQRNSITALKKKCRELGVFNEIFEEKDIYYPDNNYYVKQQQKLEKTMSTIKTLPINHEIIDKATFDLFKEAYLKSIEYDDLKIFRVHLMEYTFKDNFDKIENSYNHKQQIVMSSLESQTVDNEVIDKPTFDLFKEAYKKAIEYNDLKKFRIHLMEYTFKFIEQEEEAQTIMHEIYEKS